MKLVTLSGTLVRRWKTKDAVFIARFMPPNHIVSSEIIFPDDLSIAPGHKPTGAIRVYDLKGKLIWQHLDPLMHHDFEILPDKKIAITSWQSLSAKASKKVLGGIPKTEWKDRVWGDEIIELEIGSGPKFRRSIHENLDFKSFPLSKTESRGDWLHTNSIKYYEKSIFSDEPGYLVSMRNVSRIAFLRRRDMKVLWSSREGDFMFQHDATLIGSSLWAFDNRTGTGKSRIVQIDVNEHKVLWEYKGGPTFASKLQFYAPIMGALQILDPNTYMVTSSLQGYVFGISREKKRKWQFFSNSNQELDKAWIHRTIFKAIYYDRNALSKLKGI